MSEPLFSQGPVRQAFALALHSGFLTRLSLPLGSVDTFSTECHPSQTVHLLLSLHCKLARYVLKDGVSIASKQQPESCASNNYHLHYASEHALQQQATVKFHGVFASHWRSLAFAPEKNVQGILVGDSVDLVTPFMQAVIQTARHFATLREL